METPKQRLPRATDASGSIASRREGANAIMWLRPLVRQLRPDPEGLPSGEASLLLEFDVDGAQYVLIERRPPAPDFELSPREQEVAGMVARGYPDKTIAAELGISRWTVSTHLRRIYGKLGVHSRAAMVAKLADELLAWAELMRANGGYDLEEAGQRGFDGAMLSPRPKRRRSANGGRPALAPHAPASRTR